MEIKDRLKRGAESDLCHFGNLAEGFKQTEMYNLLSTIAENEIMNHLAVGDDKKSAERQLGYLEGIRKLLLDIDAFIADRDGILQRRREERKEKKEEEGSGEPHPQKSTEGGI